MNQLNVETNANNQRFYLHKCLREPNRTSLASYYLITPDSTQVDPTRPNPAQTYLSKRNLKQIYPMRSYHTSLNLSRWKSNWIASAWLTRVNMTRLYSTSTCPT